MHPFRIRKYGEHKPGKGGTASRSEEDYYKAALGYDETAQQFAPAEETDGRRREDATRDREKTGRGGRREEEPALLRPESPNGRRN